MSQYTISLKSIINIKSHFNNNDDVFADTKQKIKRGRELFFNFDYDGDKVFKDLFEDAFIIRYLEQNIYCNDVDLFELTLENEVKIKAPIFYEKYKDIQKLKELDALLGDKIVTNQTRHLDESHSNKADSKSDGKTKTSQFPQDINVSNFESVNFMDAGSISQNTNTSTGSGETEHDETIKTDQTNYHDALVRLEYYNNQELNVIEEFVKSLNLLFIQLW